MRPSNKSRSRNKAGSNPNRRNLGNIVNRVFESAGPDGKVRGTPQQIIDKYQVLARDAQVSGDWVAAENYLQHAEHYARLLGEAQRASQESRGSGDRDDRDDRDEAPMRDEFGRQQRPQYGGQRPEPAGLATFGEDDREQTGPVETPEEAAQARSADRPEPAARPEPEKPALQLVGGERSETTPEPQPEGEAPPKRARPRRKSKPAEVAEASAE
jgi:hypothetical protein